MDSYIQLAAIGILLGCGLAILFYGTAALVAWFRRIIAAETIERYATEERIKRYKRSGEVY